MAQTLREVLESLRGSVAIADKVAIRQAFAPALDVSFSAARLGDDCAAVSDGAGGHLLLAAEGLLPSFVESDPWFAGYCAVMVNVSDICAMGGRPTALVDVIWTPDRRTDQEIWEGMKAAAKDYGVPIVGGHTTITRDDGPVYLAAAILGRARALLTSFDACTGDELLMAVDLNGEYRRGKPFWNASLQAGPERLRSLIELPARIAENHWCRAAKDISNGGIIGTLIMLLECSRVGAVLDLRSLPAPPGVDLTKWLISFPSFGYVFSAPSQHVKSITDLFDDHQVCCGRIGRVVEDRSLTLELGDERDVFWSYRQAESDA